MSNEPTTEERLAALRQRQKDRPQTDSILDPPTPGRQAREAQRQRRSPAATARLVTVGASTTAVAGLMGAFGSLAANADGSTDLGEVGNSPTDWTVAANKSQSISVGADTAVVMVVVDSAGHPVDLRSIESAQHLAVLLGSGQPITSSIVDRANHAVEIATHPIIPSTTLDSLQSPANYATQQATNQQDQQTPAPTSSAATKHTSTSESTSETTRSPVPAPTATTAPSQETAPTPAPAPEPTQAQVLQPAPEQAPETVPSPAPTPETTVPVAQPAPVELKLPTPPPSQGNSGGS